MPANETVGRIITPQDVADALQTHLQTWVDTYLGALGEQRHDDKWYYPQVQTWGQLPEEGQGRDGHVAPAVMVVCEGISQTEGQVQDVLGGTFQAAAIIYVVGNTPETAMALSSAYAMAVAAAFTQHPHLDDVPGAYVLWHGTETYSDPFNRQFPEGWGRVDLTVHVPAIITGGHLTAPAVNRELPAMTDVSDVTTEWIYR